MRLVARVLINAVALVAAARLVDGIELQSGATSVLLVAAIFGLVNAFVKPVAKLLTLPLTIVTLGLFLLVLNAGMLQLTDAITSRLEVDGFWASIAGGVIISLVSWLLSTFLPSEDSGPRSNSQGSDHSSA